MGKQLKKIKENKRNNTLSNYTKKAYENGFNKGVTQSVWAFVEKVNELENVEGIDKDTFDIIVKHLELEDLKK